ncbi:glycosyltransferase [Marinobacter sp.]|uniref:glycosyltransferase n=1 Tax=Marinobacter sp. TaxID=50741 RepID=UPI003850E4CB
MRQETGIENGHRPIRILHITFNIVFGGTEQVIRQLVTNLPAEKFSNQVLCIDGHVGEIVEQIAEHGIRVFSLKRTPGFDWQLARQIRKEIRKQNVDIVHCHQYTPWVYGWLARIGTSAKVVFTEHGRFHPDRYRFKAALINPIMALTTDSIIAISNATKQALRRYEFLPGSKIKVIYNGIVGLKRDKETREQVRAELGISKNATVLGTVARLDPVKNQAMMIEAFADILNIHQDSWLLLVGDGPDREMLERRSCELRVDHRVILTGFKAEPLGYLCAMDIFLLTSHSEGASMTLLETMSLGIPSVVTSVGGNPEIIEHDVTGMLAPSGDVQMFSDAIQYLLNHRDFANEMGRRAKDVFHRQFSVEKMLNADVIQYRFLANNMIQQQK